MQLSKSIRYLKMDVKVFDARSRRIFHSCGFSAALLSALLMTHHQCRAFVCTDAKVAVQRVNW